MLLSLRYMFAVTLCFCSFALFFCFLAKLHSTKQVCFALSPNVANLMCWVKVRNVTPNHRDQALLHKMGQQNPSQAVLQVKGYWFMVFLRRLITQTTFFFCSFFFLLKNFHWVKDGKKKKMFLYSFSLHNRESSWFRHKKSFYDVTPSELMHVFKPPTAKYRKRDGRAPFFHRFWLMNNGDPLKQGGFVSSSARIFTPLCTVCAPLVRNHYKPLKELRAWHTIVFASTH